MQTTIYYRDEDAYIMEKIEKKAARERRSKSSCILSILEQHFESEKRIGEILTDMDLVEKDELEKGLEKQKKKEVEKKIGEILVEEDVVEEIELDRALNVQQSPQG